MNNFYREKKFRNERSGAQPNCELFVCSVLNLKDQLIYYVLCENKHALHKAELDVVKIRT